MDNGILLPDLRPGDPVTFTEPFAWVDAGTAGTVIERTGVNWYIVRVGSPESGRHFLFVVPTRQLARA